MHDANANNWRSPQETAFFIHYVVFTIVSSVACCLNENSAAFVFTKKLLSPRKIKMTFYSETLSFWQDEQICTDILQSCWRENISTLFVIYTNKTLMIHRFDLIKTNVLTTHKAKHQGRFHLECVQWRKLFVLYALCFVFIWKQKLADITLLCSGFNSFDQIHWQRFHLLNIAEIMP